VINYMNHLAPDCGLEARRIPHLLTVVDWLLSLPTVSDVVLCTTWCYVLCSILCLCLMYNKIWYLYLHVMQYYVMYFVICYIYTMYFVWSYILGSVLNVM